MCEIIVKYDDAKAFVEWTKDKSFCNSGQHICDRLATQFEEIIKKIEEYKEPVRRQDFGGF